MKKAILCLMTLCLVLCLTYCSASAPNPSPIPESSLPTSPEDTNVLTPEAIETPAPDETVVSFADPDDVFYFANALEKGRIYRQGLDGSGLVLICDVEALSVTEMGDMLCFISKDMLCRCPATGGPAETIFNEKPVYGLCPITATDLLFWCSTDSSLLLYSYNTVTGKTKLITDRLFGGDLFATGGRAIYPVLVPDTYDMEFLCYDPKTCRSFPCPEKDGAQQTMFAYGGFVYEYEWDTGNWSRYDIMSLNREAVEFAGTELDTVLGWDGGSFLMSSASDARSIDLVTGAERSTIFRFPTDECDDVRPVAQKGDTAVVSTVKYSDASVFSDTVVWTYERTRYFTISMEDGSVTEITGIGRAGAMFADGSFPKLDVSTARKPLAMGLCDLFYRGYGWDGAEPVNNKSHGAWLDLADKGCDVILAPAPTDEEKAYLAERGVEVDRKVFGADGLVFICGTGTGVTNLSMDQLKAIYRGEITNWKELGGVDHAITVFYRNDQSGSQRQFEKLVWKEEEMPDFGLLGFSVMSEMDTIVQQCQDDPYAIGYSIMTYLSDVFNNEDVCLMGIDGVTPTIATVTDNSYSLTLQDCIVIRSDESEGSPARRLYDWFGTPQCDDVLRNYGLTPVHPQA